MSSSVDIQFKFTEEIQDFRTFSQNLSQKNAANFTESWNTFHQPEGVCFYRLESDKLFQSVQFSLRILVNQMMQVQLIYGDHEAEADPQEFNWILSDARIERWDQLQRILEYYKAKPAIMEKSNSLFFLQQSLMSLNKVKESEEMIEPIKAQLVLALNHFNPEAIAVKIEPNNDYFEENEVQDFKEIQMLKFEAGEEIKSDLMTKNLPENKRERTKKSEIVLKLDKISKMSKVKVKKGRPKSNQSEKNAGVNAIYSCDLCGKNSMTRLQLRHHFYTHSRNPMWCDQCGKKFASKTNLETHLKRHQADGGRVKCPICDLEMAFDSLHRHKKVVHEGIKPYTCSFCGLRFARESFLLEHENRHLGKRDYFGKTRKASIPKPRHGRYGNEVEKIQEVKMNVKRMKDPKVRNIKTEGNNRDKVISTFPCLNCGKKFRSKVQAAKHMLEEHNHVIDPVKMCFICRKEVEDPLNHAQEHNCRFVCSTCGKRFKTEEKLKNHFAQQHEGKDLPFTCDLCDCSYKTLNHLNSHKISIHLTKEKQFKCNICEKQFAMKSSLNQHLVSHSDIRRFPCSLCDARFKKLNRLKTHYLGVHGVTNIYKCPECPERLKTLVDLKNHREQAHGVSMNPLKHDLWNSKDD